MFCFVFCFFLQEMRVSRVGPEKKHIPEKKLTRMKAKAERKERDAANPKPETKRKVCVLFGHNSRNSVVADAQRNMRCRSRRSRTPSVLPRSGK